MALAAVRAIVLQAIGQPQPKKPFPPPGAAGSGSEEPKDPVQATLESLVARAEGKAPDDPKARRAMLFSTALEMKHRGNGAFQQRQFTDAAATYELGLDAVGKLQQLHVEQDEEEAGPAATEVVLSLAAALQATLLSNRAEAFLRAKPPKLAEAAASAQAALDIEPQNEKAQRRLKRALYATLRPRPLPCPHATSNLVLILVAIRSRNIRKGHGAADPVAAAVCQGRRCGRRRRDLASLPNDAIEAAGRGAVGGGWVAEGAGHGGADALRAAGRGGAGHPRPGARVQTPINTPNSLNIHFLL